MERNSVGELKLIQGIVGRHEGQTKARRKLTAAFVGHETKQLLLLCDRLKFLSSHVSFMQFRLHALLEVIFSGDRENLGTNFAGGLNENVAGPNCCTRSRNFACFAFGIIPTTHSGPAAEKNIPPIFSSTISIMLGSEESTRLENRALGAGKSHAVVISHFRARWYSNSIRSAVKSHDDSISVARGISHPFRWLSIPHNFRKEVKLDTNAVDESVLPLLDGYDSEGSSSDQNNITILG